MKRNLDLIRQLLITIECQNMQFKRDCTKVIVEGFSNEEVNYHLLLLIDVGYVDGDIQPRQRHVDIAYIKRLTMQGHDYLDAVRNDTIWATTKDKVSKLGESATLDIIKEVAVASLRALL